MFFKSRVQTYPSSQDMSEDNVRSTAYRSLKKTFHVPHEDSNETDIHGTNRKSKTPSPLIKGMTMQRQMTDEDPLPTFISEEEMNVKDSTGTSISHSLSSSQLWQVSQGAEVLNQMVDSLSKGLAFSGHSRDIEDDLLKSASDLQESLLMLGKLQEKLMSQMKNQNPNMGKEAAEKIDPEYKGSNGFKKSSNQNHLQVPQASADGSSRSRIEELKKFIRESIYKQNLLPVPSFEEEDSLGRRNFNSLSDGSLESSSLSLPVRFGDGYKETCYDRKQRVGNYNSVTSLHSAKKPNLIAKILGLEDFPSEAFQATQKQIGSKKSLFKQCSNFNIGMPKKMKLFTDQNRDSGKTTLKEIIDTMHFKGLLKRNYSSDNEIQTHLLGISELKRQSRDSCEERMDDKLPPIVILKPLHFSHPEREEIKPVKLIQIEGVSDTKQILERTGAKEPKVMEAIVQECGGSDNKQLSEKSGGKEQKIKDAVAVEDCVSDSKQVLKKLEVEECKILESADKSYNKNKASFSLPSKQKKMEASKTCRKVNGVQKTLTDSRKSVKENTKSMIASRSQVEIARAKSKKPDRRSVSVKNHTCRTSASQNKNLPHSKHPASQKSLNQVMRNIKKKDKQGGQSKAVNSITENFYIKDEKGTVLIPTLEMNCISSAARTSLDDLHSTQTELEKMKTKDKTQEDFCSTPVFVPDPIQCRGRIDHAKEANQSDEDKSAVSNTIEYRRLLLSSPSFLCCAEDLFGLDMNQPPVFQTIGVEDGTANARLVLDCALVLMTRKSCQSECMNHHLLQTHMWGSKACTSMDQLLEALVNGIEELRCYSKIGDDGVLPRDGIYVMLQRDLLCKGMLVNEVWDLGWVNGFSMDDAEQIVSEVQKHILSGLVDEVIMDLLH